MNDLQGAFEECVNECQSCIDDCDSCILKLSFGGGKKIEDYDQEDN